MLAITASQHWMFHAIDATVYVVTFIRLFNIIMPEKAILWALPLIKRMFFRRGRSNHHGFARQKWSSYHYVMHIDGLICLYVHRWKVLHAVIAPFALLATGQQKNSRTPLSLIQHTKQSTTRFLYSQAHLSSRSIFRIRVCEVFVVRSVFSIVVVFVVIVFFFIFHCCTSHHRLVSAIVQIKSGESLFVHLLFVMCIGLWFFHFCFRFFQLLFDFYYMKSSLICVFPCFIVLRLGVFCIGCIFVHMISPCNWRRTEESRESTYSLNSCQI